MILIFRLTFGITSANQTALALLALITCGSEMSLQRGAKKNQGIGPKTPIPFLFRVRICVRNKYFRLSLTSLKRPFGFRSF
jgi:hypothetical protein